MSETTLHIGGNVEIGGDLTAGDKIVSALPQASGLSSETAQNLNAVVQQILEERERKEPDPSKIETLLNTVADAGLPALVKIATELILKRM